MGDSERAMARPTRAAINRQLELLDGVIEQHPDGIGRPEIAEAYQAAAGTALDERTLQRRLNLLAQLGRVRAAGETRARRYFPKAEGQPAPKTTMRERAPTEAAGNREKPSAEEDAFLGIRLSTAAVKALSRIRSPIVARRPVGYDEAFLREYQPGQSWYLPANLRRQLHKLGRTPDPNRAAGTFARDIFERLLIDSPGHPVGSRATPTTGSIRRTCSSTACEPRARTPPTHR